MIEENKAVKLIKFIKDNYCEEEESSFCDGILYLREQANWRELESEFLSHLTDMLSIVKKNSHKAAIIESIVEIECFDFNKNQELLDEYIFLLVKKVTTNEKAAQCLGAFIALGANPSEIFNKVAKNLNKKHAIEILVKVNIGIDEWGSILNELEGFFIDFEISGRISHRSCTIAPFLLITHPSCLEYGTISYLSFNYSSVDSAVYDWGWYSPNGARYLVNQKVVTEKEAEILQRLGDLMRSHIELDSEEIRGLYHEFFNGKNPLDVMVTLPK